jgi:UDP-N-acetylglucosamine diphosphorylase/glucosamine-1-phosphate N-acetyltransferase
MTDLKGRQMYLCIFEDENYSNFFPLTYLRPCFDLRCGLFTLSERIIKAFPEYPPHYLCRSYLNPMLRERGWPILSPFDIDAEDDRVLLINGCLLNPYHLRYQLFLTDEVDCLYVSDDRLVAALLSGELAQEAIYYLLEQNTQQLLGHLPHSVKTVEIPAQLAIYPWDMIVQNAALIEEDFVLLDPTAAAKNIVHARAVLYQPERIYVSPEARVEAMAVLDAREGPIFLDKSVVVEPFSYIQGPVAIGANSLIVGGQIRPGTSIGPVCRVGGEVEESIIQGYTNKYHTGFLGHSYLGEWVNVGAVTTSSDLKNTYSSVRVEVDRAVIDTQHQKLGVFIADHVKLGIGTLMMGGSTIGVGSNIFGGNVPKVVPSFIWGSSEGFAEYRLEKFLEVTQAMMQRRGITLSTTQMNLISHVFHLTMRERQVALG